MNFLKNLKKRITLFTLFLTIMLGGLFVATNGLAVNTVPMEGNVTSLNATKGDKDYTDSTSIMVDEVAQVQLWHHNMKAPDTDVANNTVVKFEVPSKEGKTQVIRGVSSSDNGNTVSDTTTVNLSLDKASLQYVKGSAKFKYNKGAADGRKECMTGYEYPAASCFALVSIPDSVVTTGVNLDKYRGGPLKGCNAYHETVIIQVRSMATSLKVNKYVRHQGESSNDWKTHMTAKPGDDLEYMIRFENKGNVQLKNVSVGDNLPRYHDYIEGSTKLMNGTYPSGTGISSDNVITGGIYVGNYNPGSVGYVLIRTKLNPATAFQYCGDYELTNTGLVGADNNNTVFNTTKVTVTVDESNCIEEPKDPIYSCDGLVITKVKDNTYKFTINATAINGATISSYKVDTGLETISSDNNTFEYTYSKEGNYDVIGTVVVSINNQNKEVTGNGCKGQIKIENQIEPIYACDKLTIFKVDRDTYRFTINASASNGATVKSYAVNTGTETISSNSNTLEYTYAKAGNYNITATVFVDVNGIEKTVTSDNCKGQVKVDEPEEPVYECVAVKVSLVDDTTFRFNTITRVDGGAKVKHYVYNFGDGTEATVTENVIEHKYAKPGEYNISVTVVFNVNDKLRSVECGAKVVIDEEIENCPVEGKGHLPKDSPDCFENCPIEGLTHLPKDSDRCKVKETPPTTLPNTGAGSLIGLMIVTTLVGTFAHRFAILRG